MSTVKWHNQNGNIEIISINQPKIKPQEQKMDDKIKNKYVKIVNAKFGDRIHVYGPCYDPDPLCPGCWCGIGTDKDDIKDGLSLDWCWGFFNSIFEEPKCLCGYHCCGRLICKCYCCQCCPQQCWDE